MRSWSFLLSRRWLVLAVVVVLLAWLAYSLGQWQFGRLADKKASNAQVTANENADASPATDVLAVGTEVDDADEWRVVSATGTYEPEDTVIVRYRTRDGEAGVDVVVPLLLDDGTALLVDRGWLATDNAGTADPGDVPAPPSGEVDVTGYVRVDAEGDSTAVDDQSTRAVDSAAVGQALGLDVLGGWVELRSESPEPATALEPVELPDLGNGPHFFYGLQWWFFALLAVVGFVWLAIDERRTGRRAARAAADATGATGPAGSTSPTEDGSPARPHPPQPAARRERKPRQTNHPYARMMAQQDADRDQSRS
ncbi:SURF1 family cytochrome oxidase biogenesis protein [Nocardioides bruguierae]|uniref:SURF1-like protein n=1 Tax=Nocardioides bruguierae TaxID=2945102 RepID=A0A9X2D402_9ACTN|nr:SURF1 family protein [Nocardioides bruguierae]MCM0618926.1 SURF1 family protein [Nocardioides bruguierae]